MMDIKFLPFLLMDSSYRMIDNLLTSEGKPEYLDSPSLKYYIIPYRNQRRKYFRKIFENASNNIYDMLDTFEEKVDPYIIEFYSVILEIIDKEFKDVSSIDKQILAAFHCNAVILKCAKNCQNRINGKPASQISDLINYNTQILNKLPITSKYSIDLNTYTQIQTSLKTLVNQFLILFKK